MRIKAYVGFKLDKLQSSAVESDHLVAFALVACVRSVGVRAGYDVGGMGFLCKPSLVRCNLI